MASLLALAVAISWTLWKGKSHFPRRPGQPTRNVRESLSVLKTSTPNLGEGGNASNWAAIFRVTSRRILRSTWVNTERRIETYEPSR